MIDLFAGDSEKWLTVYLVAIGTMSWLCALCRELFRLFGGPRA